MKLVNFNDLHEWGIVEHINNTILHNLGLKLVINNDGTSNGCLISDTLHFENTENSEMKKRFDNFIRNRYYNLKYYNMNSKEEK